MRKLFQQHQVRWDFMVLRDAGRIGFQGTGEAMTIAVLVATKGIIESITASIWPTSRTAI